MTGNSRLVHERIVDPCDEQLEINGYRVEPSETEQVIRAVPTVRDARVLIHKKPLGKKCLVAYVVADDGETEPTLRRKLAERLPPYRVPHFFVFLERFPINVDGKLDVSALPDPASDVDGDIDIVRAAWTQVLGQLPKSQDVNFFDAGGTSLDAMQLHELLQQKADKALASTFVFEHPTIGRQIRELTITISRGSVKQDSVDTARGDLRSAVVVRQNRSMRRMGFDGPANPPPENSLAVVGMAGRFPGADNVDEFWDMLCAGKEGIRFFSPEELDASIPGSMKSREEYVSAKGVISDFDKFDAEFFDMTPLEARIMDPQQRLMLELAWTALEHAGHAPSAFDGLIGVYVGMNRNRYLTQMLVQRPDVVERYGEYNTAVLNARDYLATRISYKLNLRGPSININTACSTSLVAIAQAAQALLNSECDMALAGGASISVPVNSGYLYQEGGMLSADGHCRSFDARAAGTVFSDGAGIVVLRRLEDALADGDSVYAVIRGFALNNDGSDKVSYTAPSVNGQAGAIRSAIEKAGVDLKTIGYIETHGTATPLGDPIEIAALKKAFVHDGMLANTCAIGSVKANVGHLSHAAGVAGLIKAVLSVYYGKIPPCLHFDRPNPKLALEDSPFFVNSKLLDWPTSDWPRRAGVSSLGVGGTNAHVIIEEPPAVAERRDADSLGLLCLSAKTDDALEQLTDNFQQWLQRTEVVPSHAAMLYTLQVGREALKHRRAWVTDSLTDARHALADKRRAIWGVAPTSRGIGFMFTGQGAQRPDMGLALREHFAVFRNWFDRGIEILKADGELDLESALFSASGSTDRIVEQTRIAQPALFLFEFALAKTLTAIGVNPTILLGHSIGEFSAAALAEVMSFEDALRIVAIRGTAMQKMPEGSMVAIYCGEKEVQQFATGDISIAALNAPELTVLSGPEASIEELCEILDTGGKRYRRLRTSHAFHSAAMEPAAEVLAAAIADIELRPPKIPIVSTATGRILTDAEVTDPDYWAEQLRKPVRFNDALETVAKTGSFVLVEVGPGTALTTLASQNRRASEWSVHPACPDAGIDRPAVRQLYEVAAACWVNGADLNFAAQWSEGTPPRIALPEYPFARVRHWVDSSPEKAGSPGATSTTTNTVPAAPAENSTLPLEVPIGTPTKEEGKSMSGSERLLLAQQRIARVFEDLSGYELSDADSNTTFSALGFDSLLLTQVSTALKQEFSVNITFRELMEDYTTLGELAVHLTGAITDADPTDTIVGPSETVGAGAISLLPSEMSIAPLSADSNGPEKIKELIEKQLQLMQLQLQVLANWLPNARQAPPVPKEDGNAVATARRGKPFDEATAVIQERTVSESVRIPLLEGQKEIWLAATLGDESNCAFNLTNKLTFDGEVDIAALKESLRWLVDRHEALRTRIADDGEYQIVDAASEVRIERHDLRDDSGKEAALQAICQQAASTPMNLGAGPLFRVRFVRWSESQLIVLITAHHIVCDGWSMSVLMRELAALYKAATGKGAPPEAVEHQLSDYVTLANSADGRQRRKIVRDYWMAELSGKVPSLKLPVDRSRTVRTFSAERFDLSLDHQIVRRLKELGSRNGCTFFNAMLAAYTVLLSKLSRQSDIVIGISAAQQPVQNMPHLVCHAVNLLPLRVRIDSSLSFHDVLREVKTVLLNALDNRECTYGELIPGLDIERIGGQPPLVNAVFSFAPSMENIDFGGVRSTISSVPRRYEIFDWFFNIRESGKTARCELTHNADAFDTAGIRRRMDEFVVLLNELCDDPDSPLVRIDIRSPEEREIVAAANRTETTYGPVATIPELIRESLSAHMDSCAVTSEDANLTFAELDRRSNRLAHMLRERGVGADVLVGVCAERSVEMVVGLLGILKAGGAYVPLDPDYPAERLAFMLEDAAVPVLLTMEGLRERLSGGGAELVCLDSDDFAAYPETPPAVVIDPDSLAYVIYTSGSTGQPKGAMNSHRAIVNRLRWMQQTFALTPADAVLQKTPFSFDVSVWEFFWPLLSGARLVIPKPGGHQDPAYLAEMIEQHGITVLHFVPSMLQEFLEQPDLRQRCRSVRMVVCSGEALSHDLQQRFFERLDAELHNLYGPTEAAVDVTHWPCRRDSQETVVPIGWPIANTRIHILDDERQPVPVGLDGELYIGGVQVGRGYLHREALTAERFTADPFSGVARARLYATGDLARWREDGAIEYRGRRDFQVKIRGLRIEPGEIEAALESIDGVQQAAVLVQQPRHLDQRLVAYYVTGDGSSPPEQALRERLACTLPIYMLPQHFMHLDAMPLSPNGKLDRKALPEFVDPGIDDAAGLPPETATETELSIIWQQLTGAPQVYLDSDFFAIGGHSLLAIRLMNRLRERFGITIPVAMAFKYSTLRGFSAALDDYRSSRGSAGGKRTTVRI